MNERIKELAEQAGYDYGSYDSFGLFDVEKFAELIVRECIKQALKERVSEEEIEEEAFTQDQCYLRGNNDGITDAVIRIEKYFGVEK